MQYTVMKLQGSGADVLYNRCHCHYFHGIKLYMQILFKL